MPDNHIPMKQEPQSPEKASNQSFGHISHQCPELAAYALGSWPQQHTVSSIPQQSSYHLLKMCETQGGQSSVFLSKISKPRDHSSKLQERTCGGKGVN